MKKYLALLYCGLLIFIISPLGIDGFAFTKKSVSNNSATAAPLSVTSVPGMPVEQWGIFLSTKDLPPNFEPFETLIFSYEQHPPLRSFLDRSKAVFADISFLEISPKEYGYDQAVDAGVILGPSPWNKEKFLVDIRKTYWLRFILETRLQSILLRGFNGVYIHSLVDAVELESKDPKRYEGMTKAVTTLIKAFFEQYPQLNIVVDYEPKTISEVASYIQGVMDHSVITMNIEGHNTMRSEGLITSRLNELLAVKQQFPALKLYVLEEWGQNDKNGQRMIEQRLHKKGFIPYVQMTGEGTSVEKL